MNTKPIAIDLFCGLGGWTEGLLAEGYDVTGYDIEAHEYGDARYPAKLVLADVLTLHGSQFKDAALIVASPPCQAYSYMAMPWKKGKAIAAGIRADMTGEKLDKLNQLFNACFRIQREACEAAGRHIPMVVENVRGAQPWVGRARWNFGSFYLWGDVPALMPITAPRQVMKAGIAHRSNGETNFHGVKCGGKHGVATNWGRGPQNSDGHTKNNGGSWFAVAHNTTSGKGQNPDGRKQGGDWFNKTAGGISRCCSSKSNARKAASAMIAKIPFVLSRHIAATYRPSALQPAGNGAVALEPGKV